AGAPVREALLAAVRRRPVAVAEARRAGQPAAAVHARHGALADAGRARVLARAAGGQRAEVGLAAVVRGAVAVAAQRLAADDLARAAGAGGHRARPLAARAAAPAVLE